MALQSALTRRRRRRDQDPVADPAVGRIVFSARPESPPASTQVESRPLRYDRLPWRTAMQAFSSRDEIAFTLMRIATPSTPRGEPASGGRVLAAAHDRGTDAISSRRGQARRHGDVLIRTRLGGSGYRIFRMDADGANGVRHEGGDYTTRSPHPTAPATEYRRGPRPRRARHRAGPLGQIWGLVAVAAAGCTQRPQRQQLLSRDNIRTTAYMARAQRQADRQGRARKSTASDDDIFKLIDGRRTSRRRQRRQSVLQRQRARRTSVETRPTTERRRPPRNASPRLRLATRNRCEARARFNILCATIERECSPISFALGRPPRCAACAHRSAAPRRLCGSAAGLLPVA